MPSGARLNDYRRNSSCFLVSLGAGVTPQAAASHLRIVGGNCLAAIGMDA